MTTRAATPVFGREMVVRGVAGYLYSVGAAKPDTWSAGIYELLANHGWAIVPADWVKEASSNDNA